MEENIRFSILVPVYQVEKYIDECIQSVLNQTYTNWELILVDDGSKDKSGEICDRYAEKDERIKVYHKENSGVFHTRRYGMDRAKGDYFVFLDSDDWLKQNALEVIYKNLRKLDCDCLIYGYERFRDKEIVWRSLKEEGCSITDKRALYRKCLMGDYNVLWRKAVRASVFQYGEKEYEPYFHIQIGEDLLQSLEILKNSRSVAFIDDRLYKYRVNPKSIMESSTYKEDDHVDYAIWDATWDFLVEQDVFDEADMAEYRGHCIWPMIADIARICSADISLQKKYSLFAEIKGSEYYKKLMGGPVDKSRIGLSEKVMFPLFVKGQYRRLIFIAGISYKYLRNVRRRMKRLLGK